MEFAYLGPLTATHGGHSVPVGGARVRLLLLRLLLDVDRPVAVGSLAAAVWGDDVPADPANALQSLVSRLRRQLGEEAPLTAEPAGYRLGGAPEAVDAVCFDRLARSGRAALAAGRWRDALHDLDAALGRWRGEALADAGDAAWAAAPRAALEEQRLAALEDRAEATLRLGNGAQVVPELDALTAEHPLRERLRGLHLQALAAAGRQADALAAYETTRRLLADELGVDPSPALQDVHLAVLRGTAAPHAPSRPARGNLRPPLTSFVGRDAERAAVVDLLGRSRLVTLVGPGGAGKTRLATETAATVDTPAWFVELAPVRDPDDLVQTALRSMGAAETAVLPTTASAVGGTPWLRLTELLRQQPCLLVLDNCEHLVAAAARFADDLLAACPGLRILATSREALGIFGEALHDVGPLQLPGADESPTGALSHAAVRLFADRAAAVRPDFRVDALTAPAVVEICRRLDGLPLAIELAAARLRSLTAPQIAERLGDRFRLLTGGSRTAMPRHQTLRAVVAWSWDLLSDDERTMLERVCVFPGGCTPDSAAAVVRAGSPDAVGPADALDVLLALVDKSLLSPVPGPEPRYRPLETIREFGLDRLAEREELGPLRRAHASYFRDLAEAAEPVLRTDRQLTAMDALARERDNLLAALQFAVAAGDADTAVRLGAALSWWWTLQGNHREAEAWLSIALSVDGPADPQAHAVAEVVHTLSGVASTGGMPNAERLTAALRSAPRPEDHPLLAVVEPLLTMFTGDVKATYAAIERSMAAHDPWTQAALLMLRANVAENHGDVEVLERDSAAALAAFRALGDRWGMSTTLTVLAGLRSAHRDFDAALAHFSEALACMEQLSAGDDVAFVVMRRAFLLIRMGDLDGARADIDRAEADARERGSAGTLGWAAVARAELLRVTGDPAAARAVMRTALEHLERSTGVPDQLLALALAHQALVEISDGASDAARATLQQAYDIAARERDMPILGQVAVVAAAMARARGNPHLVARTLGVAESLRGLADASLQERDELVAWSRAELGDSAWSASYEEGRDLPRRTALVTLPAVWRDASVGT